MKPLETKSNIYLIPPQSIYIMELYETRWEYQRELGGWEDIKDRKGSTSLRLHLHSGNPHITEGPYEEHHKLLLETLGESGFTFTEEEKIGVVLEEKRGWLSSFLKKKTNTVEKKGVLRKTITIALKNIESVSWDSQTRDYCTEEGPFIYAPEVEVNFKNGAAVYLRGNNSQRFLLKYIDYLYPIEERDTIRKWIEADCLEAQRRVQEESAL